MARQDYTSIDEPYNSLLERQTQEYGTAPIFKSLQDAVSETVSSSATDPYATGNLDRNDPVLSSTPTESLVNFFLKGFLSTENYVSGTRGFKLDATLGTADFATILANRLDLRLPTGSILYHGSDRILSDTALIWDPDNKNVKVNGGVLYKRTVSDKTGNYSLAAEETNGFFTNAGASGSINYSLPGAAAGLTYIFAVHAAFPLYIYAASGDTIRNNTLVSDSGGFLWANSKGSVVRLTALNATEWFVEYVIGTWKFQLEAEIFDTITVTESVTVRLTNGISVSDTITVTESVTVNVV